ncbi:MAG: SDR family oxidoreductase, partial [Candidatus Competibacteraceae bacterium]|nr:SDR family oxidoreductase [Candidatus Competibacteraceae bacterium]
MRVALFGGTGFVGSYLVRKLLERQHQPVLLVRPGSESKVEQHERCVLVPGDINDLD